MKFKTGEDEMNPIYPHVDSRSEERTYRRVEKVLVVEDDRFWQILIGKALRNKFTGVKIEFVENARRAIQEIERRADYDFVVADFNLGEPISGLDLWDLLCEREYQIPYVIISGQSKEEFFNHLRAYRTDFVPSFIQKPSNIKSLSRELGRGYFNASYTQPKRS